MKIIKLLRGDIYFQYKYGFYLLYAFFTCVYIAILHLLPNSWHQVASALIIISDPALIGLVFIGAIVLFEKSERVLNSIAVSPINVHQYIISKIVSITIVSLLSGLFIAYAGAEIIFLPTFILGITLGSILFSLIGLIISTNSPTLNAFILRITPIMTLATLPVVMYLMGYKHWSMQLFPSVSIINLILNSVDLGVISILILTLWIAISYYYTVCSVQKMIKKLGGGKL